MLNHYELRAFKIIVCIFSAAVILITSTIFLIETYLF